MIYILKRHNTWNVGDLKSNPADYFLKDYETQSLEIDDQFDFSFFDAEKDWLIIGGGGLWCHAISKWMEKLLFAIEAFPERIIIWGIGENYYSTSTKFPKLKAIKKVRLIGVREFYEERIPHVPCVSCMDPLFEKYRKAAIEYKKGFYLYYGNRPYPDGISDPIMKNNRQFEEIIPFLASCEIVYTNCYHGAYWSSLLGKKCILFNCSTHKGFKYPIKYLQKPKLEDLYNSEYESLPYTYLSECIETNKKFAKSVIELINS